MIVKKLARTIAPQRRSEGSFQRERVQEVSETISVATKTKLQPDMPGLRLSAPASRVLSAMTAQSAVMTNSLRQLFRFDVAENSMGAENIAWDIMRYPLARASLLPINPNVSSSDTLYQIKILSPAELFSRGQVYISDEGDKRSLSIAGAGGVPTPDDIISISARIIVDLPPDWREINNDTLSNRRILFSVRDEDDTAAESVLRMKTINDLVVPEAGGLRAAHNDQSFGSANYNQNKWEVRAKTGEIANNSLRLYGEDFTEDVYQDRNSGVVQPGNRLIRDAQGTVYSPQSVTPFPVIYKFSGYEEFRKPLGATEAWAWYDTTIDDWVPATVRRAGIRVTAEGNPSQELGRLGIIDYKIAGSKAVEVFDILLVYDRTKPSNEQIRLSMRAV